MSRKLRRSFTEEGMSRREEGHPKSVLNDGLKLIRLTWSLNYEGEAKRWWILAVKMALCWRISFSTDFKFMALRIARILSISFLYIRVIRLTLLTLLPLFAGSVIAGMRP
jgi:hypothetical protein